LIETLASDAVRWCSGGGKAICSCHGISGPLRLFLVTGWQYEVSRDWCSNWCCNTKLALAWDWIPGSWDDKARVDGGDCPDKGPHPTKRFTKLSKKYANVRIVLSS